MDIIAGKDNTTPVHAIIATIDMVDFHIQWDIILYISNLREVAFDSFKPGHQYTS